jgi:1,4-dihydroxy-2-naphthoate octaprenyltransferase
MSQAAPPVRSVITCDLEGRIETFNKGAETLFGYAPDEVIGKKRVSLFSPGLVVLDHVGTWLSTAVEKGSFETDTVFVDNHGKELAAHVKITPTFKNGEQIGYCGVTVPLDVDPDAVRPEISLATRLFVPLIIVRAPFLSATLIPVFIGAAWAHAVGGASPFPWALFALTAATAVLMQLSANTFNDYFDWTSGTDEANNEYFMPFTGGSRSIELGLITPQALRRLATTFAVLSLVGGAALMALRGWPILALGAAGLFAVYFYTAPPLRLAGRKGLGELFVGLCFGPLMVGGAAFALSGVLDPVAFLAGVPIGLLTTAILWINEFPDLESDRAMGKVNLVVVLGKPAARWGFAAIMAAAFGLVGWAAATGLFPTGTLLTLISLPMALYATWVLFTRYEERSLVSGNKMTIFLQVVAGLLFTAGLLWGG